MPPLIRKAMAEDTARIGAIARAAYAKYVPRIGREPAPMVADFAAEVAAGHVVVIGTAGAVDGYMIAWPEADAYLIDNIAIDPARQGQGLGRQLMDHAVGEAKHRRLSAIRLYTNAAMTENLSDLRPYGVCRNPSGDRKGIQPGLSALDSSRRRRMTCEAEATRAPKPRRLQMSSVPRS
jgi:ribosomal protein S18 acetylase RimI-like enzyme